MMRTRPGLTTISAALAVIGGAAWLPPAMANGCLASYSTSYLCLAGDTGKGTFRNALSMPTLNSITLASQFSGAGIRPGATALGQGNRLALGQETGAAAAAGQPRWNLWFAAGENHQAYNFQPAQSTGTSTLVLGGIEYTFANNMVGGLAVNTDRTRSIFKSNLNSPLSVNGYSFAPYLSIPFAHNWLFDASIGFGRSDIKVTDFSALATGDTNSNRTYASLAVTYATRIGAFDVQAKANYVDALDKVASFTMTDRTFIPASNIHVSQVRLGAQAAYNAGVFTPFVGATYVSDIQSPNAPTFGGQTPANDKDGWQLTAGVNIYSRGAVSGGLLFSTEVGRQQVKNDVILANIAVRF